MGAHSDRSLPGPVRPHEPRALDREVMFVGVVVWVAALIDVVGILAQRGRFTGLHAIALVALAALTLASLRQAAARLGGWLRARRHE
jgi:hypothetical protein